MNASGSRAMPAAHLISSIVIFICYLSVLVVLALEHYAFVVYFGGLPDVFRCPPSTSIA